MNELFSYSYGYKAVKSELQNESIDLSLRNALWNSLGRFYLSKDDGNYIKLQFV